MIVRRAGAVASKQREPGTAKPYSRQLLKYEWGRTYETLVNAAKATDGSPYDIMMQYVNPATGGPVMKTLGAHIQLLRGGERTKAHRHTGSVVYTCAKGSGTSIIAGKRYDWSKNDIFVVPSWSDGTSNASSA